MQMFIIYEGIEGGEKIYMQTMQWVNNAISK